MKAMNKKLLKWLAITACSLTCATTLGVGVSTLDNPQTANAYVITLESANALESTYEYGSTFTVPMGTIEGVKTTRYAVIAPSGYAYDSKTFTLSEAGEYTIRWYATVGGREVSAEKSFKVAQSAITLKDKAECKYVENLSKYDGNSGLKVELGVQSTFTYNGIVDLRNEGEFIHMFPYHSIANLVQFRDGLEDAKYNEDARNYYITLTDCYDPTNSITIDVEWQESRTYYNLKAGPTGYISHGLRTPKDGTIIEAHGEQYSLYLAPQQGMTQFNAVDGRGIKFYYNLEKNQLRATYYRYYNKTYTLWDYVIADLDHPTIYPDLPFTGFTTGEVYVSLSAANLINRTANIDIASIGGVKGKALMDSVTDNVAPTLQVSEELETMKKIAVNETISLPQVLAMDTNLRGSKYATAAVYYGYNANSENNALVGIVNGKFTPKKTGVYTVVYTAEDTSGNVATKTINLECVQATGNKAVNLNTSSIELEAGAYADIPAFSLSGLYADESAVKLYYLNEDGEQELYTDSQIFLDRLGEFKFTYVYETPYNTYTATAVINAIATDKVLMGTPALPEYFIKGAKYTLDTVLAQEYTETPTGPVEATMYMKADDGSYVEIDPQEVTINANSTVQFKYVYGTGLVESDPIKVLDVGFGGALSAKDYFYTESTNVTKNATKDYLQFITSGSSTKSTLTYINPLAMSSFDIEFNFVSKDKESATYVDPARITFTFTDYYDRSKVATFSLRPAKAGLYVDVNGVERVGQLVGRKFLDITNYISYQNGVMKFEGSDYDMGNVIKSDRILFEMTIENATSGKACMNLTLLCDNTLTSAKFDSTNPKLTIAKTNMGYQSFNSVITISTAVACDLIAPYLESGMKITVIMPDGSFAKSEDGVTLDGTNPVDREYQVKLNQVGVYSVVYSYTDQNGGFESFAYSPIVKDSQGPTIVVEGKVEDEVVSAKWGASVTVATYSVSDDITAAENIDSCILVTYPSAIIREIPNGGSFYAEEKGRYTVMYYAYDEIGNVSWFIYYVQVA